MTKKLQICGTLTCTLSLIALYISVLTQDWLTIQEPYVDSAELEKLSPYDDNPKTHLVKAKFGLVKVCVQNSYKNYYECFHIDYLRVGGEEIPSELVKNCVEKMRFTIPFIFLSVIFTTGAFLSVTFGHFCQKNKKIVEACFLIVGGLCQATALLTYVSQIGSNFSTSNTSIFTTLQNKQTFYNYKYGYSFYLFLLSFSLSELAALLDMAAYFKKYPSSGEDEKDYFVTYNNPSNVLGSSSGPGENDKHHPDVCLDQMMIPPPMCYMNSETDELEISHYGTSMKKGVKVVANNPMESFATLGRGGGSGLNRL